MRETDDFKFNVNLVLIDLGLRHGMFAADEAAGLRAALDRTQDPNTRFSVRRLPERSR